VDLSGKLKTTVQQAHSTEVKKPEQRLIHVSERCLKLLTAKMSAEDKAIV